MRQQFIWSFAAQAVSLVLPPMLVIVLARILEPSDFGVFALLTIIIGAVQVLSIAPLGEVIVKSSNEDVGDFIFTLQLLLGIVASIGLLAGADLIASFFKKPELAAPLRVSCLLILVMPLVETAIRMSMRRIAFRAVFVRRVVAPVVNAMISIPLALYGGGFWALVWGQIGGMLVAGLVIVSMGGWRPRFNLDISQFIDDLAFSWQMLLQGVTRWVRNQSDKAILGYHISFDSLGQYGMARLLAGLPFAAIINPVAQVMYAVMSENIRRGEEVGALFLLAQRRVLMITFPLCAIMLINAQGLVTIILGSRWLGILDVFVVMALVSAVYSPIGSNVEVFKAMGKPHIMTRLMLVQAAFSLAVFLWLAPHGIYAIALGFLGLSLLFSPLNVYLTLKLLGVRLGDYLGKVLLRPLALTIAVVLVCLLLNRLPIAVVPAALLNVVAGGLTILVAGFYWERELFTWKRG